MKLLKEMAWVFVAVVGWYGIGATADHLRLDLSLLVTIPLFMIFTTAMVVGVRRGWPDGIWGIK